ncbi:NAD-dependent epimerase/dehydratase family protein [Microlunatus ginsengisoli]|uniref:NAD-dependent epimerase/dehydratase family protein n=1 Tax=Microlunatus ginsengisoli TaxID=363863 RepID=A0ABP6ZM00_9ACTN
MSRTYVIVGAGPVGRHTAEVLRARGEAVTLVTRSGTVRIDGVESVAADASNPTALSAAAEGATALFNCANPTDYTTWEQVWPPLADSLLVAAERTGATLVTASCLYPYGPTTAPMVEGQPDAATDHKGRLRAGMWAEAKARHDAGRIRAVEVRGSDYVGAGVGPNGHVTRHLPAATQGKAAWVIGRPDLPHSWTDVLDMARTLAAVADRPDSWGRVWHAPTNEPRSQRQALTDVLAAGAHDPVPVHAIPMLALRGLAVVNPLMREIAELSYMWTRPYVLDSAHTRQTLGLEPTPWDEVCRRTATGNLTPVG